MRLRTSLLWLSTASALPILVFAAVAAAVVVQRESSVLVTAAKARNRAVMSAVDAELRGVIGTLHTLTAASPDHDDLRAFHSFARRVLETQPGWRNVILVDSSGKQVLNARLEWGAELPSQLAEPGSFEATVSSRKPTIGDIAFSAVPPRRPGVSVRVPIVRDGNLTYVLTAVLDPSLFQRLMTTQNLPAGWASGLVDRTGRLIARVPEVPVGTRASPHYLAHTASSAEGWYRGLTVEGRDTYTSFMRSELTGWTIGYAIPVEQVNGGATRAAWILGGGLAVSIAVAAWISLLLGRRVADPMQRLVDLAPKLAGGSSFEVPSSSIAEVQRLTDALVTAANDIRARDAHLLQSQEALRTKADQLEAADANKSNFLALLAHELRNPLAPIRSGLAVLRLSRDPAQQQRMREVMERQLVHMTRMIEDLLDVSRVDRGKLELRPEVVAIDRVLDDAIETIRPTAEGKGQRIEVSRSPQPLYVQGDPVRLNQVVSNLLHNASKFSPEDSVIKVDAAPDGDEAVISVTDHGRGFEPADAERMFGMFVQLKRDVRDATPGLGIGLTMVRSLVEAHGGRVTARSAGIDQGSTFEVRLPRSRAPQPVMVHASPTPTAPGGAAKVLIVDDNQAAADAVAEVLRLEGFDVQQAYGGAEALAAARDFKPTVAFIDLDMPGMDGRELAKALRAESWASDLRIFALSGLNAPAGESPFDEHLTKPAASELLIKLAGHGGHSAK